MSDLWRVEVEQVEDGPVPAVTLRVRAVHPDAGGFPETKVFALRLLTGAVRDRSLSEAAVTSEEAERAVDSVEVSDVRNCPFDEEAARRGVEGALRNRGLDPGHEDAWWQALGEEWAAFWNDPGRTPSARYAMRLADPQWLRGTRPGEGWDSAAYG
ncbi:hypothetical protein [Streptomyces cinnamoneus]|uniref:Uncharacterized protein n=1 Tax=Streptomyces cinnamoneus TaxID=53446 RepID=A0A918TES1_STRCJ|nr:hypothetical protein [Streptomyces cinnamoneus]GHC44436.1 hypothetical protein GCM10010507_19310 [Streptomyces cinnamoneus]